MKVATRPLKVVPSVALTAVGVAMTCASVTVAAELALAVLIPSVALTWMV